MNFSHKNFLPWDLLEFIGDGILMPVYPGNKFFENSGRSKFGCTENSQINITEIVEKLQFSLFLISCSRGS